MKEILIGLGFAMGAGFSSVASAQEPPEGPLGRDTDGDGYVSREEALASAQAGFARLDANRDGTVTFDEFQVISMSRFDKVDTNGDDLLSREELEAGRPSDGRRRRRRN